MFGFHTRTFKNNQDLRKNRNNMFSGNDAFVSTYGKGSNKEEVTLTKSEKQEIEVWTTEVNRKRTLRLITTFGIIALLTTLIVYSILAYGSLDAFLNFWTS